MTTKTFLIPVQDDHHLQRIAQIRKPILALAELIWNVVETPENFVESHRERARWRVRAIRVAVFRPFALRENSTVCANEHRNHISSQEVG